jgi:hypothetical protein
MRETHADAHVRSPLSQDEDFEQPCPPRGRNDRDDDDEDQDEEDCSDEQPQSDESDGSELEMPTIFERSDEHTHLQQLKEPPFWYGNEDEGAWGLGLRITRDL